MKLSVFKKLGRSMHKNAPSLLVAGGVVGVGVTVVMAVRATPKAMLLIDQVKDEKFDQLPEKEQEKMIIDGSEVSLTPVEYVKACWKLYLPVVAVGVGSCMCFIWSHKISSRRQAALATAYGLSQQALRNYQEQVIEKVGDKKEREARELGNHALANPENFSEDTVINTGHGNYLFYDYLSGRWFRSDIEFIRGVKNTINQRLMHEMWISGNDYYFEMDMPQIGFGKDLGWRIEDGFIDFDFSYGPGPNGNGESCCVVTPTVGHWPNYKFGDLSR